jgi:L-alanine-DL-glutamate epimerase-like enolase superfamily enzyme
MPIISEIRTEKVNLKLTRPYTIAFRTVERVENAIVRIELDNGIIGHGSGNPSPKVVGEDISQTMSALQLVKSEEIGNGWRGLIGRNIEDLELLCKEIQQHLHHSPTARAALEIGLHDCLAQSRKVPLVKLLGQTIESMPTSITIGIKDVEETLEEAREYFDRGFRYLKVKLGNHLQQDIERILKLREQFGDKIKIRVDANQGYTVPELKEFYQKTKGADVELIEQPLPAGHVEHMRSLSSEIRQMLAADESLIDPDDARNLVREDLACGIFNIKLMKCGGITKAREISAIAERNQVDLMWGCNDESIISITAALHTALACKNTRYLDLDGSLDLAEDVVSGGFIMKNGEMSVNGLPGLGLSNNGI